MPAEIRHEGNKVVQKINIIGTNLWAYSAWEKDTAPLLETPYRTITHIDNSRYGKIGSDMISRAAEARELIDRLFPEATRGAWDIALNEVNVYA